MVKRITVKTNPKLYAKWARMRQACFDVKCGSYRYIGSLGIFICPEWSSYENFYYWALDNGYSDKLCLTRKDRTKAFSPDNCKWADYKEINSNKTDNHCLVCPKTGKKQTVTDWAKELKIPIATLLTRVRNMSIEKALTPGRLNQKTGKYVNLKNTWYTMNRCLNVDNVYYKDVTLCDDWLEYANFEKWAYENGYQENLMLGRKDTSKDFCPENCYWTTRPEINRNKKNNVKIYYRGEAICLTDIAKKLGIDGATLARRLDTNNITSEKLFHKGKIR
jgi:hypothetical protein